MLLVIWIYFGDMHADGFGAEAILKMLHPHPHPVLIRLDPWW